MDEELCKWCSFVKRDENGDISCTVWGEVPIIKDGKCNHFLDISIKTAGNNSREEIAFVDYYRSLKSEEKVEFRLLTKLAVYHSENMNRIISMEEVFNEALAKMNDFEKEGTSVKSAEFVEFQSQIDILEQYLSSNERKEDLALDEAGKIPACMKRGVLSEDGIYNLLERFSEFSKSVTT